MTAGKSVGPSAIGTGIGGVATFEEAVRVLDGRGADRVSPYTARMIMPNAAAAALSLRWGLRGPAETITTACAAGTHSVAAGARMLVDGTCDLVLAGASDASLRGSTVAGFTNASAMSRTGVSRPFDRARDGFVAAEGAAVLVLEPLDAARARGARVCCVLAGSASNADAYDMTAPSPGGRHAEACMRLAVRDAGLRPEDVAHVNAHGTSTPLNDAAEALEAAAVCLSFAHRALPPTSGFAEPDDDTAVLDVVRELRPWEPGPVVSNSFGFGGHNGSVVFVPA